MLPFGASLLTSMNPLAAKIWIAGWCACHTSTAAERRTIVPSRALPDPAKRRSRRSPEMGAGWWTGAGMGFDLLVLVLGVGACAEVALEVVPCAAEPEARCGVVPVTAPPAGAVAAALLAA
jgi:hypothetical protein